jgi:glycosyltransferase involved in cell wall biosynthesis
VGDPAGGSAPATVAINGRAAVRAQIGGVERLAREMATRLPALRPDRYQVITPSQRLAHRAGHVWEQAVLPVLASRCALIYSPANLAPVAGRNNVLVIHDAAPLRHPEAYSKTYLAYQRALLPVLARRARLLMTVSEFSRRELVEVLGVAPERITVIPPGVDERFFAPADTTTVARRHGLDRPYVLVVGTVSQRKNLDLLAPLATTLRGRGMELVLAGSGRGYLRAGAVPARRLGYVPDPDLPGLYAGARALVMPSLYEGFGLPCLEAMAAGAPVVATARAALPETVGDAGLLADPDDVAAAVLDVCSDDSLRHRLIEAGRRRAAAFPWDRAVALTDAAIGALLRGPSMCSRGRA